MPQPFSKEEISSFLYFGYIPQISDDVYHQPWSKDQFKASREELGYLSEPQLISKGIDALKSAFDNIPKGNHIVPLSGGLDSRAILGGLLDAGLKDQLTAVTFGTPGTWDYDIGAYVAGQMEVRHETIDLRQIELRQDELIRASINSYGTVRIFDSYYNSLARKQYGRSAVYWSGVGGDALTSVHLPMEPSKSFDEAINRFIKRNKAVRSIDLIGEEYTHIKNFLSQLNRPFVHLSYDDQLVLACIVEGNEIPILLESDYVIKTPLLESEWIKFIYNIPWRYRVNQYLYIEILKKAYPKLFSLPVKSNLGLAYDSAELRKLTRKVKLKVQSSCRKYLPQIYRGVSPGINYIDFDLALRNRKDLKTLVYKNIQDLKQRGIVDWIDIDGIWKRHQARKANHADALTLLTSLEIYLKVNNG